MMSSCVTQLSHHRAAARDSIKSLCLDTDFHYRRYAFTVLHTAKSPHKLKTAFVKETLC